MNSKKISLYIIGLGILISGLISSATAAPASTDDIDDADIEYPIAELGNCKDKEACKTYCDDVDNTGACITFAEKNNLMSADEIKSAKKFIDAGGKGPGGCAGRDSCESYCDDISHIDE